MAANISNDIQNIELLYLFDIVPKPWRLNKDPGAIPPPVLPVSNVVTAIAKFQRDDDRLEIWLLGRVFMQGWYIQPGSNNKFDTTNKPIGPVDVSFKNAIDPQVTDHRTGVKPHSEIVFDSALKDDLKNRINNVQ